jgi:predicted dehydrogenase
MEKLRIGIVGLRFGKHIVENQIAQGPGKPYFELGGICDLNVPLARAVAEPHGVATYASFDAMLADARLPVIGLFTPPHGRAELVRKAIRAGKDVMTTKPFELDPEAALSVLQEARRLGRTVHMNSPGPLCAPEQVRVEGIEQFLEGSAV